MAGSLRYLEAVREGCSLGDFSVFGDDIDSRSGDLIEFVVLTALMAESLRGGADATGACSTGLAARLMVEGPAGNWGTGGTGLNDELG